MIGAYRDKPLRFILPFQLPFHYSAIPKWPAPSSSPILRHRCDDNSTMNPTAANPASTAKRIFTQLLGYLPAMTPV